MSIWAPFADNTLLKLLYSLNKNLPEYNKYFGDELKSFQDRAKNRAKERIQEEIAKMETVVDGSDFAGNEWMW